MGGKVGVGREVEGLCGYQGMEQVCLRGVQELVLVVVGVEEVEEQGVWALGMEFFFQGCEDGVC